MGEALLEYFWELPNGRRREGKLYELMRAAGYDPTDFQEAFTDEIDEYIQEFGESLRDLSQARVVAYTTRGKRNVATRVGNTHVFVVDDTTAITQGELEMLMRVDVLEEIEEPYLDLSAACTVDVSGVRGYYYRDEPGETFRHSKWADEVMSQHELERTPGVSINAVFDGEDIADGLNNLAGAVRDYFEKGTTETEARLRWLVGL